MFKPTPVFSSTLGIFAIAFLLTGFQVERKGVPAAQAHASPLSDRNLLNQPEIVLLDNTNNNRSQDQQFPRYDSSAERIGEKSPGQDQRKLDQLDDDSELMTASIHGLRIEEVSNGVGYEGGSNGISIILADNEATVRLYGERFSKNTIIRFVTEEGARGSDCDDLPSTKQFHVSKVKHLRIPLFINEINVHVCLTLLFSAQ